MEIYEVRDYHLENSMLKKQPNFFKVYTTKTFLSRDIIICFIYLRSQGSPSVEVVGRDSSRRAYGSVHSETEDIFG